MADCRRRIAANGPAPTVMAGGIGDVNRSQYDVVPGVSSAAPPRGKPSYRIPSMAEIRAVPRNGRTVVSTFSGCGGSCLGFEMAGFEVAWASEFVSAAAECHRLNFPTCALDIRDLRAVQPGEILEKIGKRVGEVDVLDGSPPCQSFSTAGKRHRGWNKVAAHGDGSRQRSDDLFFEFARILAGVRPKAFVAENVSGLVKGVAKGYFLEILAALKGTGYRVRTRVLDAQWLGVPQKRQRVIFIGIREDLGVEPEHPAPLLYRYSLTEACPWIIEQVVGNNAFEPRWGGVEDPHPSILANGARTSGFVRNAAPKVVTRRGGWDGEVPLDPALPVPTLTLQRTFHVVEPEASMDGTAVGREWDGLKLGGQSGRYFNLVRPDPDESSPTVTAAGGNAGTAGIAHPTERRKFSIEELKRVCGFPDDFVLTGTYAQRRARLGNAVPPPMIAAVARKVAEVLDRAGA